MGQEDAHHSGSLLRPQQAFSDIEPLVDLAVLKKIRAEPISVSVSKAMRLAFEQCTGTSNIL